MTIKDMKDLEDSCGISKIQLMENAGRGIYKIIKEKFELKDKKVLVAAYHGNNGGDGFVVARLLAGEAIVDILFLGSENRFKEEALVNFNRAMKNPMIQFIDEEMVDFDEYDIIVDAILGIGIKGDLKENIFNTINGINKSKAFKLSVDVPTGLDPDTGKEASVIVDADIIATFHDMKPGLEKYKEKTVVVDIGIKS